jgi:hypothetical protein
LEWWWEVGKGRSRREVKRDAEGLREEVRRSKVSVRWKARDGSSMCESLGGARR